MSDSMVIKDLKEAYYMHSGLAFSADETYDLWAEFDARDRRIAKLEAAQRWIPVSERLPNLFKTVIIARAIAAGRGGKFDLAFNCGLVWVGTQQDIEYEDVTHWMPLPQPPEAQE